MKLIVGLGNPGPKYARTRHNVGFMLVDAMAEQLATSPWRLDNRLDAELAETELHGQTAILAKPQTFMNDSGLAVQKLMQAHRMKPENVWVIHDEVDLEVGEIKVKQGGSAGSKGVQSVIEHIGPDFHRIRVGIGQNDRAKEPSEDYVLRNMPAKDAQVCLDKLPEILEALQN